MHASEQAADAREGPALCMTCNWGVGEEETCGKCGAPQYHWPPKPPQVQMMKSSTSPESCTGVWKLVSKTGDGAGTIGIAAFGESRLEDDCAGSPVLDHKSPAQPERSTTAETKKKGRRQASSKTSRQRRKVREAFIAPPPCEASIAPSLRH